MVHVDRLVVQQVVLLVMLGVHLQVRQQGNLCDPCTLRHSRALLSMSLALIHTVYKIGRRLIKAGEL